MYPAGEIGRHPESVSPVDDEIGWQRSRSGTTCQENLMQQISFEITRFRIYPYIRDRSLPQFTRHCGCRALIELTGIPGQHLRPVVRLQDIRPTSPGIGPVHELEVASNG